MTSTLTSIGPAHGAAATPGQRALEGLATFDRLAGALRARQDAIAAQATSAAAAYPVPRTAPADASVVPGTLTGALAGFLATPSGHQTLERLAAAVAPALERLFSRGMPQQLPLPLDV